MPPPPRPELFCVSRTQPLAAVVSGVSRAAHVLHLEDWVLLTGRALALGPHTEFNIVNKHVSSDPCSLISGILTSESC